MKIFPCNNHRRAFVSKFLGEMNDIILKKAHLGESTCSLSWFALRWFLEGCFLLLALKGAVFMGVHLQQFSCVKSKLLSGEAVT